MSTRRMQRARGLRQHVLRHPHLRRCKHCARLRIVAPHPAHAAPLPCIHANPGRRRASIRQQLSNTDASRRETQTACPRRACLTARLLLLRPLLEPSRPRHPPHHRHVPGGPHPWRFGQDRHRRQSWTMPHGRMRWCRDRLRHQPGDQRGAGETTVRIVHRRRDLFRLPCDRSPTRRRSRPPARPRCCVQRRLGRRVSWTPSATAAAATN